MTMTTVLRGILRSDRFAQLVTPYAIDPLTVDEYIEHVLVLEVAVKLISEDMLQSREEDEEPYTEKEKRARALQILKESREYGRLRFGIGSEYLAEEDQGNGATQMVIADVRGFVDDSEDEMDDAQSSSEAEEEEAQAPSGGQQSVRAVSVPSDDEAAVRLQLESSPQEIEDDEARPASREILALESSPIQSPGHRSPSPPFKVFNVDSPEPSRTSASQIDSRTKPVSPIDVENDDFDVPGTSLDAQLLIDAANGVEESHYQQEKPKKTAQVNGKTRPPPKFANPIEVSPEPTALTTGNGGSERTQRPAPRDGGRNRSTIVHDVDDDDPLASNLSNHRHLVSRTQARQAPHNARPGPSTRDWSANGGGTNGSSRYGNNNRAQSQGFSDRRMDNGPANASPYHFNNTAQGTRQVGLSKRHTSGPGASGSNGRETSLFHKRQTNQALANRQQNVQVYGAMTRK